MASGSSLYGVIDIGSNSVRLVIFDASSSPPHQLINEKVFCGLARDLDRTGRLSPAGAAEALTGLIAYGKIVRESALKQLDVVGTAALRDAADGAEFIRRVADEAGLSIRLISGHEEARYAALGVLALAPAAEGLVADFGGGSLEFAKIEAGQIGATISRPYGAFRALAMGDTAQTQLADGLSDLIPAYGNAPALHTIGGSWRALAQAYAQDQGQADLHLQGYTIPTAEMTAFCQTITGCEPAYLRDRYGFEENRATLAPISALVLHQVLEILKPDQMVVSLAGIRDGIVYDLLHPSTKTHQNV